MATVVSSPAARSRFADLRSWARRAAASEYLIYWLSVLYVGALAPFVPGFVSGGNLVNLLFSALPLFLLALGQTFVLITGGIDLSVTAVVALTSVIGAFVMNGASGWLGGSAVATPGALLAMMAVGTAVGLCNGLAVARLRMPAFIVTLTGMMFFSGFAIWLTQSKNIGGLPAAFIGIGSSPWMVAGLAVAVGAFAHLLLTRSLFGHWLFAVGHNVSAARVSGVPVAGVTVAAYSACGYCAALAGILYTGQAETGSPVLGQRLLLDVIGATVLGGTSLFGGRGKVLWTLGGVLFLKLVDNSLNLLSLSLFTITMVKGGVILGSAVLDVARQRLRKGGVA